MKTLLLSFTFAVPMLAAAQSVPNGNFETWTFGEWFEEPEYWNTDNSELNTTVSKDFDAHEGELAMRVIAQPYPLGLYGEASTLFEIDAVPEALNFYAKWATESGSVSVEITFLNEETELYSAHWMGEESMAEYTLITIPLAQLSPMITHARITVSALVGDLVIGTAWISVDAMEFGQPMGLHREEKQALKLYPNPTIGQITLEAVGQSLGRLSIFDSHGRLVQEVQCEHKRAVIQVQHLPDGLYTIVGAGLSGRFVVK